MTGTTVKNAQMVMANVMPNAGKNAKAVAAPGGVDFQAVWNNQMEKNMSNTANTQDTVSNQPSDTKKPEQPADDCGDVKPEETVNNSKSPTKDAQPEKADKTPAKQPDQTQEPPTQELPFEELEAVMEILGTAAEQMMYAVADAFDISPEELQATLDELEMEPMDLLQPEALNELVLKLGGAEDSLALVTDETLCDNYKSLMQQMNAVLDGAAKDSGIDAEQLGTLLNERQKQTVFEDEMSVETVLGEKVPDKEIFSGKISDERVSRREKEPGLSVEGSVKTVDSYVEEENRAQGTANETNAAEDRKGGERQPERESDGGQQGNPFAQELKNLQPETEPQQAQSVVQTTSWDADTQDIMRQIMDYMKLQMNADTTNLEMQLHPASLGTLHIQVESRAGVITANFITQNEAVKAALESQIVQLKENFEEQGVKVEAIEVMVQSHAFERNLEQGREQNQGNGEPSRRARVRRINLNDLSAMEDMEEEDALAADMLAAGGSTVDYTA